MSVGILSILCIYLYKKGKEGLYVCKTGMYNSYKSERKYFMCVREIVCLCVCERETDIETDRDRDKREKLKFLRDCVCVWFYWDYITQ